MSRFPLPSCPHCHGAGEIEHIANYTLNGRAYTLIEYSPCPCTHSPIVDAIAEYEDWTKP